MVYITFLTFAQTKEYTLKNRLNVMLLKSTHNPYMKNITFFHLKIVIFTTVKIAVYHVKLQYIKLQYIGCLQ